MFFFVIFFIAATNNSASTNNPPRYQRYHHQSRLLPEIPTNSQPNRRGPPPPYSPRVNQQAVHQPQPLIPRIIEVRNVAVNCPINIHNDCSSTDSDSGDLNEHRLRRIPSTTRNNAFCPDLVRHCTPTTRNDDEDYICIDDTSVVNANFSRLSVQPNRRSSRNHRNEPTRLTTSSSGEVMGQSLSLRRPKISLTWVLREQQSHHNHHNPSNSAPSTTNSIIRRKNSLLKKSTTSVSAAGGGVCGQTTHIETKKTKKSRDEINEKLFSEKYVNQENAPHQTIGLTLLVPPHIHTNGGIPITVGGEKFREPLRKSDRSRGATKSKFERSSKNQLAPPPSTHQNHYVLGSNQSDLGGKSNYSEPSVYTTVSEGAQKRHRPRKRKERNRSQRFGYDIKNVDEFLSRVRYYFS